MGLGHTKSAAFKEFWKKTFGDKETGTEFDETVPEYAAIADAFHAGYEKGWKDANNYDPHMDAD